MKCPKCGTPGNTDILKLQDLVQIQGEILASMSRETEKSPELLEIQYALSNEHGKNVANLWKLRGEEPK